jgi:hypothetical protein
VVAGTATAVSGRVQRRQAEKYADRDQAIAANRGEGYAQGYEAAQPQYAQAPAPAPAPAAPAEDPVAQLQKLGELHAQGILSDDEFAAAKAKIIG